MTMDQMPLKKFMSSEEIEALVKILVER